MAQLLQAWFPMKWTFCAVAVFISGACLYTSEALAQLPANTVEVQVTRSGAEPRAPVQLGRPFRQGEILHRPIAIVDGQELNTQADIKQRWPDGSVRHATLSFHVQGKPGERKLISFADSTAPAHTVPFAPGSVLDGSYNFDMTLVATSGLTTRQVSAREMLVNGDYEVWLHGDIATTVILRDHSEARRYDFGFGGTRPLRPIFHATFWHLTRQVTVRAILEVANVQEMENVRYSVRLLAGLNLPVTTFEDSDVEHHVAARWTRVAWIGVPRTETSINHNAAYLASTTLVPNFDTSREIPPDAISRRVAAWNTASKELLEGSGNWQKAMGTAGGRPDIGIYPSWVVQWLVSGNASLDDVVFGNADIAASWPVHFRETVGGRPFYRGDERRLALGRVVSIAARPTAFLSWGYIENTSSGFNAASDRIHFTGESGTRGWKPDAAHQPETYSLLYLVTGDYWYLEQGWFWVSWTAASANSGSVAWGRGPTGAFGGIPNELRGQAWTLRTRAHVASVTPDGTPEQDYLSQLVEDAIAYLEGFRKLATPRATQPLYKWAAAHSAAKFPLGLPPLRHWEVGSAAFVQSGMDPSVVASAHSVFEHNFMLLAVGRTLELGYDTGYLLRWSAPYYIGVLTDPASSPYFAAAYRTPTVSKITGQYFRTWAEWMTGFEQAYRESAELQWALNDSEHGYPFIALAAISFLTGEPGGEEAWEWVRDNTLHAIALDENPKWAILPRSKPISSPRKLRFAGTLQ